MKASTKAEQVPAMQQPLVRISVVLALALWVSWSLEATSGRTDTATRGSSLGASTSSGPLDVSVDRQWQRQLPRLDVCVRFRLEVRATAERERWRHISGAGTTWSNVKVRRSRLTAETLDFRPSSPEAGCRGEKSVRSLRLVERWMPQGCEGTSPSSREEPSATSGATSGCSAGDDLHALQTVDGPRVSSVSHLNSDLVIDYGDRSSSVASPFEIPVQLSAVVRTREGVGSTTVRPEITLPGY